MYWSKIALTFLLAARVGVVAASCSIENTTGAFIVPHNLFGYELFNQNYGYKKLDPSYATMTFQQPEGDDSENGVMMVEWCNNICDENPDPSIDDELCIYNYQQFIATQSGFSGGDVIPFTIEPRGSGAFIGDGPCSAGGVKDDNTTQWCLLYELCTNATNGDEYAQYCDRCETGITGSPDPLKECQDGMAGYTTWLGSLSGEYNCASGKMHISGHGLYLGSSLSSAGPATKIDPEKYDLYPFICLDPSYTPTPPPTPTPVLKYVCRNEDPLQRDCKHVCGDKGTSLDGGKFPECKKTGDECKNGMSVCSVCDCNTMEHI